MNTTYSHDAVQRTAGMSFGQACQGGILVVDDEQSIRKVLRIALEKLEYYGIEAKDGQQAISPSSTRESIPWSLMSLSPTFATGHLRGPVWLNPDNADRPEKNVTGKRGVRNATNILTITDNSLSVERSLGILLVRTERIRFKFVVDFSAFSNGQRVSTIEPNGRTRVFFF